MNYQAHYDRLIMRARFRDHSTIKGEWHHAIPRCMGGTHQRTKTIGDLTSNVVKLTYAEHITAHRLLCRVYPNNYKLTFAIRKMLGASAGKHSRRLYEMDRKRLAIAMSTLHKGSKRSIETKTQMSNSAKLRNPATRRVTVTALMVKRVKELHTSGMTYVNIRASVSLSICSISKIINGAYDNLLSLN